MLTVSALLLITPITIVAPKGNAARLDGVIGDTEWKAAREIAKQGSSRILAMHDGEALYLALIGDRNSIASIHMESGNTVRILHASAALGEATYVPAQDKWNPSKGFEWACRKMDESEASRIEQAAFYQKHGWLANTTMEGKIREYKLNKDLLKNPLAIALYGYSPVGLVVSQPQTPGDDVFNPRLIGGFQPESLKFNSDSWIRIKLG